MVRASLTAAIVTDDAIAAPWIYLETRWDLLAKLLLIRSALSFLCKYSLHSTENCQPHNAHLLSNTYPHADPCSTLSLHLPSAQQASCCGVEWMTTSPRISPASATNITCNNAPLVTYPTGQSFCHCKLSEQQRNPSLCYQLLNYSSLTGPGSSQVCSAVGCPAGQRPYATGSKLPTCYDTDKQDNFTLYETACQGSSSNTGMKLAMHYPTPD